MKRSEIIQMEAGYEMDSLVAKRVMGWKKKYGYVECYEVFLDNEGHNRYVRNDIMPGLCWMPSRRISDAWEVVEEMMKNGICRISNGDGDSCDVDFWSYGSMVTLWDVANVTEDTFPLAICKASLIATMEIVNV